MTEKKRGVGVDLGWSGIAVAGEFVFDDVGNVDVGTGKVDRGDELVEDLPGGTLEVMTSAGFVDAGGFGDEDDVGLVIAFADDGEEMIIEAVLVEGRGGEVDDFVADAAELGSVGGHGGVNVTAVMRSVKKGLG